MEDDKVRVYIKGKKDILSPEEKVDMLISIAENNNITDLLRIKLNERRNANNE